MGTQINASGILLFTQIDSSNWSAEYNGTSSIITSWPVTFNNTDTPNTTLEVQFTGDLSFNSTNQYFVMDSSNITVDGSNHIVNIDLSGAGYPGLFQNGTYYYNGSGNIDASNNANSNITIQNITIECHSSSLLAIAPTTTTTGSNVDKYGNGWLCQAYYGRNGSTNSIDNCSSNGGTATVYWVNSNGIQYNNNTNNTQGGCILGDYCSANASNCYSIGTIGTGAGGIFGQNSSSQASATNCYSTGTISGYAGGIFGSGSSGSATNCYSIGTISDDAGGIFGASSSSQAIATNCYSIGDISGNSAGGIFGQFSSGSATKCYYTNGSANWRDASANAALNPLTAWTDIDLNSENVPYLLSAFTETMYSSTTGTDAATSGVSIVTDSSFSIVSVNGLNPSLYSGITIDANTGDISFTSLQNGVYIVNVLATNTNDGYSFGTFTNNVTTLEASGTVLLQQVGTDVQYSTDAGSNWSNISVWPVTLNNTDTPSTTLEVQFTTDLSFNYADQYFIMDSSNITVDGSNHIVTIDVVNYPGVFQNGTLDTSGNSYITIQNLGVESIYSVAYGGGWIGQQYFGNGGATNNLVTNCYSTGTIGQNAGGIFGQTTSSQAIATNCYSTGDISGNNAGGIFGYHSQGSATDCYSTGTIGYEAGGIFAHQSLGSATNCYSTGRIGELAGGIFGYYSTSKSIATNCYSTGPIGLQAGGIFGYNSSGSATNCYSTGTISDFAGGIFGKLSTDTASATNCYSIGTTIGTDAGGIFGYASSGSRTNCYSTKGITNWRDASANAALNVSEPNAWTDINLSSDTVPYLLSAFTATMYSSTTGTDAGTSGVSILSDCSFSIVSVNGLNPSLYSGITIDSNTGEITFTSLQNGVYIVNVLATNAINKGYSFGTFTNNVTTLDASGTVLLQQVGTDVQYSTDSGSNWTNISVWPVTLNNTDTPSTTLEVQFTTDLSFNSADQYFIMDSSNITVDGSNHVVNVNVSTNDYPGLIQNGTNSQAGNSYITIQNLGVDSSYSVADNGGWISQQFFGKGATNNLVTNCYSTGPINGIQAGGIFGQQSLGSATNCYSTGTIGENSGGIFGTGSSSQAINCYSTGAIGTYAGGIFGSSSQGSATNCYSTGPIGSSGGGIFGYNSGGSATNCYCTGGTNIGVTNRTYCYATDGSANWLDASANAALNPLTAWTDINLSSQTVPYLLSAFTSTLYSPSSATDVSTSNSSIVTDSSFSIVSINSQNPSLYPGISIDANTGDISFNSLINGVYEVNVLATNASNKGYSFGTFTNNSTAPLDASGTLLLRQQTGSDVQYSSDGSTWTNVVWPVSLINSGSIAPGVRAPGVDPLIITFTSDLSFNSVDQYFVLDSSNIIVDGSNHIVNVNVDDYPGVFQNGTGGNAYSNITIQNLGVESSNSVAPFGGWIGQEYFGNGVTNNLVTNCYSSGTISDQAGGIFGSHSQGSATNCYSTGNINGNAGGIFGYSTRGSVTNCYSTGPIGYQAGGIFGKDTQNGTAINCYSTGPIVDDYAGGIFGDSAQPGTSASNCYSIGDISGNYAGGIFGSGSSGSATNCYSTGTISGDQAGGIFGYSSSGSATNCYSTNGSTNWLDASANAALDVSGNYTDIDLNSTNVPYRLTSFNINQILYDPSGGTNVNPEVPDIANPTDYTWSITSVNGSTSIPSGIYIDASNGDISFSGLSAASYAVNVLAVDRFGNYSYETFTNIISNICFPAGTPIVTNQGIIAIHKINPAIHTIRNKKIVAITKTVSPDKYLIKFEKDALGANLPCEATTMTQNHMLFYKGQMMKAKEFLKTHQESVTKVPYNGQVLYNVLMEEHDKMVVNNLICETLHPENYVAKMHQVFKMLTPKQRVELIQKVNKEIISRDIFSSTSTFEKGCNEVRAKNGNKVRIQLTL